MKSLYPFLVSPIFIIAFPFIGTEVVNYFYIYSSDHQEKIYGSFVELVEKGTTSFFVFTIFLVTLLFLIATGIIYRKVRNKPFLSTRKIFYIAICLPLFLYLIFVVDLFNPRYQVAGFYVVVSRNDIVRAKRLIAFGVDPNHIFEERNPRRVSPLMIAAEAGSSEMVRILIEAGADKSLKTTEGYDAEYFARKHGHMDIARVLHSPLNQ